MFFHTRTLAAVVLASLVCAVSGAVIPLAERSSLLTFTVINKCKHDFAPMFVPPLPGMDAWPVVKSGASKAHKFRSDTYKGIVFSPLKHPNMTTGAGATIGEIDLESGNYDISIAKGYSLPMYLTLEGMQSNGFCTPAKCASKNCKDAYKKSSGLVQGHRVGVETASPNHSCPPGFTNWIVQFC